MLKNSPFEKIFNFHELILAGAALNFLFVSRNFFDQAIVYFALFSLVFFIYKDFKLKKEPDATKNVIVANTRRIFSFNAFIFIVGGTIINIFQNGITTVSSIQTLCFAILGFIYYSYYKNNDTYLIKED